MTLNEAIKHAEEVAEAKEIDIENQDPLFPNNIEECKKCAAEHRQLAEWLKELKQLRETKIVRCKDCKYFEYDSVMKVNGMRLIVAHEICKKWGDGCQTKEYGHCFLFEPQERSDKKC